MGQGLRVAAAGKLAVAGVIVVAGCGGGRGSGSEVVSATYAKTAAAGSARVAVDTSIGPEGQAVTESAIGIFDFARHLGAMDMVIQGVSTTPGGPGRGPASSTTLREILVGDTVYTSIDLGLALLGRGGSGIPPAFQGKDWVSQTRPGGVQASSRPTAGLVATLETLGGLSPGAVDPGDELQGLAGAASSTKVVGSEEIRGVTTTHYAVSLDPQKATAGLSGASAAQRQQAQQLLDLVGGPTHTIDLWVDDQDRARRLRARLAIPGANGSSFPGQVQLDYWDFGVPVDVSAPPAAEVVSWEDLLASYGCRQSNNGIRVELSCGSSAIGSAGGSQTVTLTRTPGVHSTLQLRPVLAQAASGCGRPSGMNPDPSQAVVLQASDGYGCYSLGPSQLSISRAKITADRFNGSLVVSFELSGSDAAALDRVAQENYHRQVAMVMFGAVLSAPTINATAFHGSGQISGLTEQQASQIASALDPSG